jgi:8-oxo-dGTP pyrophosphatase MutT (NUDIX family)
MAPTVAATCEARGVPIALGARRVAYRLAHAGLVAWWHVRRPHTRGVKCLLVHDGHVLFVRHSYGHRDTWELPGGSLRRGEVPEDAARREAHEELGVDLTWRGAGLVPTGGWGKTTDLHCFTAEIGHPALDVDAVELVEVRWAPAARPPQPLGVDVPAMLGLLPAAR